MKVLAWLAALAALMMVSTTAKANEWGTLRPNLYFGPRLAVPESPLTGLAWFSNGNYQALDKLRHACDQHHALSGYGYTAHNARDYAKQSIRDPESNLDLHLEWVAATDTNDWTLRVSGTPLDSTKPSPVSLLFYSGFDRPAHGTPHALAAGAIDGSPSDPEGLDVGPL
ncbi:mannosyl oligosaccharide glucosidase-domain-containing protein [Blastocladiella britannica]|nr:mannosyl oligosaccharide glucosidase-domain-containing protein [Blastocladiella britannica]